MKKIIVRTCHVIWAICAILYFIFISVINKPLISLISLGIIFVTFIITAVLEIDDEEEIYVTVTRIILLFLILIAAVVVMFKM